MGVSPANFNSAGQYSKHYIPGVYTRRHTIGGNVGASSGNLVILGASMGGKPLTLHCVTDLSEAKDLLVSGDLLNGVANAFNGSTTYIPQEVYCMRINNGSRSQRIFKNNNAEVLTVKSADYGIHTNQMKMWIKAGTTGRKITASFRGSEAEVDNILKKSMSIKYTGSGESASCTINATGLTLTALDNNSTPITDDCLTVPFAEFPTLKELVLRINDTGVYNCVVIDTVDGAKCSELDYATSVSVSGVSAAVFNSDLQAFIDALKTISFIGDVTLADGANRVLPENDNAFIYFTGGTAGTSTVVDWAGALTVLENEDVQIIATPSTDADVHTLIADHCTSMSTVRKKKERTFILGTASTVSIENGLAKAKSFNSELGSVIITGANANNPITGKAEDITPALLACKIAGMEVAAGVSTPLTNKAVKVNSFSTKYTDSQLNKMIAGGIMPFGENEDGELVCIRAMTTFQGNSLVNNERSMIRSVLFMDRDIRKAFGRRTGTNNEPSESDVIGVLNNKSKEWYTNSLITKSDSGELVMNAKVRFDGDKTYLTFERFIRAPNNFTFITGTNKVYSSTVEV